MNLNEKWDDDLILQSMDYNSTDFDEDLQKEVVIVVAMYFEFFGHEFTVWVDKNSVDKDWRSITMEGASKLFSSLEDLLEGDLWPKIQDAFKRYQKHYDKINGQESEVTNV